MQNFLRAMRSLAAAAALTVLGAGSASAQAYWDRVDSAQRQMNAAGRNGRFSLAAQQCMDAIDRRRAEWITVWCDLAAREADRQRSRARRRDYAEDELGLLWNVAWLQAVEGVQYNGFLVGPQIERANIADDATRVRRLAYLILGGLRGRDLRDTERHVRELGRVQGVNISPEESLLVGRRRLLAALLTQPRGPDRLWAIAAVALTFE